MQRAVRQLPVEHFRIFVKAGIFLTVEQQGRQGNLLQPLRAAISQSAFVILLVIADVSS